MHCAKQILAVSVLAAGVTACSGVRKYTWEIELTTDTEPHVVELWYAPDEKYTKLFPAYSLSFPQSYYAYRDNHESTRQTAIGLYLDRQTLKPLTEMARNATGVEEPLSTPRHKEGELKKVLNSQFGDRGLFVRIHGSTGGLKLRRPDPRDLDPADSPFRRAGFQSVANDLASNNLNPSLPPVTGYSTSEPIIVVSCLSDVKNCLFMTDYENSRVAFALPRSEAAAAHDISRRLLQLLDRHRVPTR